MKTPAQLAEAILLHFEVYTEEDHANLTKDIAAALAAAVEAERARCEGIAEAAYAEWDKKASSLMDTGAPFRNACAKLSEAERIRDAIAALAPRGAAVPAHLEGCDTIEPGPQLGPSTKPCNCREASRGAATLRAPVGPRCLRLGCAHAELFHNQKCSGGVAGSCACIEFLGSRATATGEGPLVAALEEIRVPRDGGWKGYSAGNPDCCYCGEMALSSQQHSDIVHDDSCAVAIADRALIAHASAASPKQGLDDLFGEVREIIARLKSGAPPDGSPEFRAACKRIAERAPASEEEAAAAGAAFIMGTLGDAPKQDAGPRWQTEGIDDRGNDVRDLKQQAEAETRETPHAWKHKRAFALFGETNLIERMRCERCNNLPGDPIHTQPGPTATKEGK